MSISMLHQRNMNIVFMSSDLRIGVFTCPQPDLRWIRRDRVVTGYLLVFPWNTGIVTHAGGEPVVADSTRVMMYNLEEQYTRAAVHVESEQSVVFAYSPQVIMEASQPYEPGIVERPQRPLTYSHGPVDAGSMLLHKFLLERARGGDADPLMLQELGLRLLERVVGGTYAERGRTVRTHRDRDRGQVRSCGEAIRALLARRFADDLHLDDIAAAACLSTFHAARLFRRHTGTSIHQYRDRLRLHAALRALGERGVELARLALDLGYEHQSHFTNRFTRYFGISPGRARRMIRDSGAATLSKILQDLPPSRL